MGHRAALFALELALARRDEEAIPGGYDAVLHDEFIEFGASGRRWTRAATIELLHCSATTDRFRIEDFAVDEVAPHVVLVTYTGVAHGEDGGTVRSRRSSLWIRAATGWRLRFHQGTAAPAEEV